MKPLLLLAASLPAFSQCTYTFAPAPSQEIDITASASTSPNTIAVTTACNWLYSTDASWITFPGVTNLFGSGNGAISWEAAVNLGPGLRTGHITVAEVNGGTAVFTVVQAAPNCTLLLNPASVSLPVSGGAGSFQVQTNCAWVAASQAGFVSLTSPSSGTLNGDISYSVAPDVCVSPQTGAIAVQSGGAGGPIQTFQVSEAGSQANLTLTPATLSAPAGGATGMLAIATNSSCSWSAYSDVSWMSITGNSSGNGNYNLAYAILANPSAARTGSIHVGTQLFTVTQAAALAPAVTLSALGNGADYAQGAVSPGEVVVLYGSNLGPVQSVKYTVTGGFLPTTLGGVQVLFGNVAAPLLFVSAQQVNAVAPFEVTGSTTVQVSYGGALSNALTLPVQATTPGILTLDSSGFGGGAILNQDLSVNTPSNPAAPGSVVAIYCVGGGVTNPPSADGAVFSATAPVLAAPATVTIGGMNAQVLYHGAVSGSIAGLTQINAIVPPGLTAQGQLPILVTIGGVPGQSGVTVAIH